MNDRVLRCGEIVVASDNAGKLAELRGLLADLPPSLRRQSEFGVAPPAETGLTFVENALIKARAASEQTGLPAIADDSGLEVDALDGAPGVRSARFAQDAGVAAAPADADAANRAQLRRLMRAVPAGRRAARFHCVLVLLRHPSDPVPILAQGHWEGELLEEERGAGGFGYDSLFFVPSHNASAAELAAPVKNALSHRAQAARRLRELLVGA